MVVDLLGLLASLLTCDAQTGTVVSRALSDLRLSFVTTCEGIVRVSFLLVVGRVLLFSTPVLADAATCDILLRVVELPRTAAVLGEMGTQWQQKMGSPAAGDRGVDWRSSRCRRQVCRTGLRAGRGIWPHVTTEGAARSIVLKGTQVEPFMGSWHGERWLTVTRPSHRTQKIQGRKGI